MPAFNSFSAGATIGPGFQAKPALHQRVALIGSKTYSRCFGSEDQRLLSDVPKIYVTSP
jgi:hypothetical protein